MSNGLLSITYRTANGFGEATNKSVFQALGDFGRFCTNQQNYVNSILAPPTIVPPKLLKLPDELLLNIALSVNSITRNQDLRHLALTCRRFRNVAQEALICTAVVTPEVICKYLEVLLQNPQHLQKLSKRLQLHATQTHSRPQDNMPWALRRDWDPAYKSCYEIMTKVCDRNRQLDWAQDLSRNGEPSRSACLAVLILLVPKLEEMSFTDVFIQQSTLLSDCLIRGPLPSFIFGGPGQPAFVYKTVTGWRSMVIKVFAPKIRTLEVIQGGAADGTPRLALQFREFLILEHLSVPAKNMVFLPDHYVAAVAPRPSGVSEPLDVLPSSIKSLRMYVGNSARERGYLLQWLEKLHQQRDRFPSLRLIQLFYTSTLVSFRTKLMVYTADKYRHTFGFRLNRAENQLTLFGNLEACQISVEMFFLKLQDHRTDERLLASTGDDVVPSRTTPEPEPNDMNNFHKLSYAQLLAKRRFSTLTS